MLLRLVIKEGPLKGEEVLIRDAIVIGRKGVDLNLQDPKVSSKHARIYKDEKDVVTIDDLSSSNGTYVNDQLIASSPLKVGDKINIGKTVLFVEDQPLEATLEKGTWQEVIEDAFNDTLQRVGKVSAQKFACKPFNDPITLDFIKGLQAGRSITFGFGPRSVGKLCSDGLLIDTHAPDVAFELYPIKNGLCELRTQFEGLLLNGKKFERSKNKKVKLADFREKLKNGDRISVGQTVIVVRVSEIV